MKVSLIMPTYRREEELRRALLSAAGQNFREYEIIVVDDNDDNDWNEKVRAITAQITAQFPALELVLLENHPTLGSARARNVGIEAARGEYITFLDDDDKYLPEKLSSQYAFMEEGKLDYSITDLDLYYDNGKLSEHRRRDYLEKLDPDSLLKYHLMYHLTGTDTMMFRREFLKKIHGFAPVDVGDEFYLMQRAIEARGRFGYLQRCDVKAYVHKGEGGLSSGDSKIDGENHLYEYKKRYFSMLPKNCARYITMRHYCVLAFAYLRMKRYGAFALCACRGLLTAPIQCVRLLLDRKK